MSQERTPKHAAHAKPASRPERTSYGNGEARVGRHSKHGAPSTTDALPEAEIKARLDTQQLPKVSEQPTAQVYGRRRSSAYAPRQVRQDPFPEQQTQAYAQPAGWAAYAPAAGQVQAGAGEDAGPYAGTRPMRLPDPAVQAPLPNAPGSGFTPGWNMEKKRGGKAKAVIGVILVLLLALVGFGVWFVISLNGKLAQGVDAEAQNALTAVASGEPFYALILGSDSREGSGTSDDEYESGDYERSDVMMLVRVDPKDRKLTIVSIPRDTPYQDEAGGWSKINECFNWGGAAASIKAVEKQTGVKISHYASVRFSDLQAIVDRVGGVDVDVDIPLSYEDALTGEDVYLEPGRQHLDGQHAQLFARARKDYDEDQDEHRQENVRQLMVAVLQKVLEVPVTDLPGTVMDLAQYVSTDMAVGDFTSLALAFAGGEMTVYEASGPWDGDLNPDGWDLWMCYQNPEGWAKLMAAVDAGEDPEYVEDEYDATSILWPPSTAAEED